MGKVSRLIRQQPDLLRSLLYATVPFRWRYNPQYRTTLQELQLAERKYYDPSIEHLTRLKEHLAWCQSYVPYYRETWNHLGFCAKDIRSNKDIEVLPLLTKDMVRNLGNQLLAEPHKDIRRITIRTSGSTGTPLELVATPDIYPSEAAFITHAYAAHGSALYKDWEVRLRTYAPHPGDPLFRIDKELRRLYLSAYHIGPTTIDQYVQSINASKASTLTGYPSSLYLFACEIERRPDLHLPYIQHVHAGSETMLPQWKQKIQETLGLVPYMHYGQVERAGFMYQCTHSDGAYHGHPYYGALEAINDSQEPGLALVATGFLNRTMPLVRYVTGDRIKPIQNNQCSCKSPIPLFCKEILGRQDDILKTSTGAGAPGVNFYTMMSYQIPGIEMFKIRQHRITLATTVEIVPKPGTPFETISAALHREMSQRLGSVPLDILQVETIERSAHTGKIKVIEIYES